MPEPPTVTPITPPVAPSPPSRPAAPVPPLSPLSGFRLKDLPSDVQDAFKAFKKGSTSWPAAVQTAIDEGRTDPNQLADLVFFMQHKDDRMFGDVGRLIEEKEPEFYELRAEWILYHTIVTRMLNPSIKPGVFLPPREGRNYEDFVAAQTTGRITLMVNGRNWDGSAHRNAAGEFDGFKDDVSTYNQMQEAVESLRAGDFVFIAGWEFFPTLLPLTEKRSGLDNWGALLRKKAEEGVKVRVIIAQLPPLSPPSWMTDVEPLNKIITKLPNPESFEYIVSRHPFTFGVHHQKFMVMRKGRRTVAFCGGLDISGDHTPERVGGGTSWGVNWVWHDVHSKLEGLIARDLEREFVEHWNRERDKSTAQPVPGWKPFERLTQSDVTRDDYAAAVNKHKLQMLRTVSVGPNPSEIRRDDIWAGYFRLIGRATRFIYLENQYFHEPKLAEGIVRQAEAQSDLIVIVVVGTGTNDPSNSYTENALALRLEFFQKLFSGPLAAPDRLRVYTLNYPNGITHSKLILVDDEALSVGSANANPRGFFLDSELNVMLDDPATVEKFRRDLWAHNLGVAPDKVATWTVSQFIHEWEDVASSNFRLQNAGAPEKMVGEGVIPFKPTDQSDPRFKKGKRGPLDDIPLIGPFMRGVPPKVLF